MASSLGLALAPQVSFAQTDQDRAAARSLATQGADAFKAGKHAESLDLFTRAESLVHAPPHLLYMARAQVALGKLVVARETYLKITREQLAAGAPPAFKAAQGDAQKELTALEPRLGSLRIIVNGGGAGVPITMDGQPVSAALLGVHIPADPGKHTISASPPGQPKIEISVNLAEGEKKDATLALSAATPAPVPVPDKAKPPPVAAPTDAPPPVEEPASGSSGMKIAGFVGIGLGVAGAAVGTIFLIQRGGTQGDADDAFAKCDPGCTQAQQDEITSLDSDASGQGTIGVIGLAAGGALIAGGVTLVLLSHGSSSPQETGRAHIEPWLSPFGGGVRGTF